MYAILISLLSHADIGDANVDHSLSLASLICRAIFAVGIAIYDTYTTIMGRCLKMQSVNRRTCTAKEVGAR